MFGFVTCGAGSANAECWRLIKGSEIPKNKLFFWTAYAIGGGLVIITFFTAE
jgi:hypothetical protein